MNGIGGSIGVEPGQLRPVELTRSERLNGCWKEMLEADRELYEARSALGMANDAAAQARQRLDMAEASWQKSSQVLIQEMLCEAPPQVQNDVSLAQQSLQANNAFNKDYAPSESIPLGQPLRRGW